MSFFAAILSLDAISKSAMTINDNNVSTRLTETENQVRDEMQKQSSLVIEVRDRLNENNNFI
jgi:hypothetical protein